MGAEEQLWYHSIVSYTTAGRLVTSVRVEDVQGDIG